MDEDESLSHTTWTCKYHVVFIPKCSRKRLYLDLRRRLGEVFRNLALERESKVEEGRLMPDHVHMLLSIQRSEGRVLSRKRPSKPLSTGYAPTHAEKRDDRVIDLIARSIASCRSAAHHQVPAKLATECPQI